MMQKRRWILFLAALIPFCAYADQVAYSNSLEDLQEVDEQPTLFEALEMLIHKASQKSDMQAEANDLEFQEELATPIDLENSLLDEDD